MVNNQYLFSPAGDDALYIQINDISGEDLQQRNNIIANLSHSLQLNSPHWLIDVIPAFDTLLVVYDSLVVDFYTVRNTIKKLAVEDKKTASTQHRIPVLFDRPTLEMPFDLPDLLQENSLSEELFIDKFCCQPLKVYAIGFLPNFAYLGEIDKSLQMHRLSSPRNNVPQGAVAIADRQAAIYPKKSAGGWRIVGYCPVVKAFGSEITFKVGDNVVYEPVSLTTYQELTSKYNAEKA